jgi:hypothetical protein
MYKTIFSVAFVAFGLSTVSQASANCGPFGTIPEADFCVACATGQGLKVSKQAICPLPIEMQTFANEHPNCTFGKYDPATCHGVNFLRVRRHRTR